MAPGSGMTMHDLHALRCGCDGNDVVPGLLPLDDALRMCTRHAATLEEIETLPLARSVGRHLARPIPVPAAAPVRPGLEDGTPGGEMAARDGWSLKEGHCLNRRDIAMAAAMGMQAADLRRRARIALLASSAAGAAAGRMLSALMDRPDCEILTCQQVEEGNAASHAAVARLAEEVDLIVTIGGVPSPTGPNLNRAFAAAGGESLFNGVAIEPAEMVSFGRLGRALWLGLPDEYVAAFVGWFLFGRAVIGKLQGARGGQGKMIVATAGKLKHRPGRCELRPTCLMGFDALGRARVGPAGASGPGATDLARADGLLLIPAQEDEMRPGDLLEFYPFHEW